jgi:hypothetical protein
MQHVHDLVWIAPAPERFFRLAKQRSAIFGAFRSSHDISVRKTMIPQWTLRMDTIFSEYFGGGQNGRWRGALSLEEPCRPMSGSDAK